MSCQNRNKRTDQGRRGLASPGKPSLGELQVACCGQRRGSAVRAHLNEPYGVELDADGNLFIVDRLNYCVRRVDARTGTISTVAGTGGKSGFGGDGGPATAAHMNAPIGAIPDPTGNLVIADQANHRVRKVDLVATPSRPAPAATAPGSPSNTTAIQVTGTAPAATTVKLYVNASCSGPPAATGTAAAFAAGGIAVTALGHAHPELW